jgi:hypothetical protein
MTRGRLIAVAVLICAVSGCRDEPQGPPTLQQMKDEVFMIECQLDPPFEVHFQDQVWSGCHELLRAKRLRQQIEAAE